MEVGKPPDGRSRVQVGSDEIGELGEGRERHRRLVFGVEEGQIGPGAVIRVPADEDRVLDAVVATVVENGPCAPEVDAVPLLAGHHQRRDGPHVDHGVWAKLAEDVLRGALADVDLVDLDRRLLPAASVDARRPS